MEGAKAKAASMVMVRINSLANLLFFSLDTRYSTHLFKKALRREPLAAEASSSRKFKRYATMEAMNESKRGAYSLKKIRNLQPISISPYNKEVKSFLEFSSEANENNYSLAGTIFKRG